MNSNETTSPPWPLQPDVTVNRNNARTRWLRAFTGALIADFTIRKRDWRVALVATLGISIAIVAAFITANDVRDTMADRKIAMQVEHERWLNQGKKYAHSAAHYGVYVFKPMSALSAVEPGIERFVGSTVWLEAHKQNEFIHRPANDKLGASRQFPLTPAFVLQVLAPLAMIFLGFGVFASERERGNLKTLRMTAAPLTAIGAARALMLLLLGLLLALPAAIAVAATLFQYEIASPFTDGGTRLAIFAVGYIVYLSLWALLIVACSAWVATARTALAVLVALWVSATLIVPRAAVELASLAHQLPSQQAFREEMDRALGEPHDPVVEARERDAILAQYGVKDIKDMPVNWAGINMQRGEERGDKIFDTHYGKLFAGFAAQSQFMQYAAWLSPTVAVSGLASAAAASDTAHHLQFMRDAEAHRRIIQREMNQFITVNPERDGKRIDADQNLWQKIPRFDYRFPTVASVGGLINGLSLLLLLIASIVFFMVSLRRLNREAFI